MYVCIIWLKLCHKKKLTEFYFCYQQKQFTNLQIYKLFNLWNYEYTISETKKINQFLGELIPLYSTKS